MTDWLQKFADAGAVWHYAKGGPHARYEMADSHADFYLNTDVVVSHMDLIRELCTTKFLPVLGQRPEWIITYNAPVAAGIVLATIMAEVAGTRIAYADLKHETLSVPVAPGASVAIVVDDIHSGGSLKKLLSIVEHSQARITGPILTLANFSGRSHIDSLPIHAPIERHIQSWPVDDCPLCREGSMAVFARREWDKL